MYVPNWRLDCAKALVSGGFSFRLCLQCFLTIHRSFFLLFFIVIVEKGLLSIAPKLEIIKEKINKFDFMKIKTFS